MSQSYHVKYGKGSKSFISISSDNRVRLWDVDTSKERRCFVEKHHLSHTYSCSAWAQQNKDDLGLFAVGSSDGLIIIWDLTRGVVSRSIGKANESPVPSDIAFSKDLQSIFVSYASSSQIEEFNVSDGELKQTHKGLKKGTFKLASSSVSNSLLAASGSIKLFDMDKGTKNKLSRTFSSGGASCISFSDCGRFFVCASSGVGEVLVFDTLNLSDDSEPIAVVPVNGPPVHLVARSITTQTKSKKKNSSASITLDIICVLKDAKSCVVRISRENGSSPDAVPVVTQVPIESSKSIKVLTASFSSTVESDGSVVVAVGSASAPRFVRSAYLDTETASPSALLASVFVPDNSSEVTAVEGSVNGHSNGSALNGDAETSLVGPYEMGAAKRPLVPDDDDESSAKRSRVDSENTADNFETMEERLRSLSSALEAAESRAQHEKALSEGAGHGGIASKESIARPTSDSLVMLVEQALQSGDDGLLEQCLQCGDEDVVNETARRLPAQRVVALLRRLVAKFEKRPTRGVLVTRWIQAVLKYHVSFLLAVPDLAKQLAGLSQMLDQRLSTYTRLASLAGRLDLLMAQQTSSSVLAIGEGVDGKNSKGSKKKQNGKDESPASPGDVYYEE